VSSNKKLLPLRQLRIPLLGLLLIVGGVFAYRAKPVLSTQMEYLRTLTNPGSDSQTYTWLQRNPSFSTESISKEGRIRRAINFHSNLKQAYIHKQFSLQSTLKQALLRRRLASAQKLNSNHQEQTYTWMQRGLGTPNTRTQVATTQGTIAPRGNFPQKNGIYLYGESPQPNKIGRGYIIFDKQKSNVVGALYIPGSEFSCFYGTISPSGQLAMTVKGFAGESGLTEVATNNTIPRLDDDQPNTYTHSVALQEYYQINSISAKDHEILHTCKANLRN
jgi:hypothetical protein